MKRYEIVAFVGDGEHCFCVEAVCGRHAVRIARELFPNALDFDVTYLGPA